MGTVVPRLAQKLARTTNDLFGAEAARDQSTLRAAHAVEIDSYEYIPFVSSRGSLDLYQLAMAPVLLPRKVEMPKALSAGASDIFSPSCFGLDTLVKGAGELVRNLTVPAEASLEVESEEAGVGTVDARFIVSAELSSSTALVLSER